MRNTALLFVGALQAATLAAQVPAGGEFRVNTYATGPQYHSSSAATGDGRFVVAWESGGSAGSKRILGRRFSADGVALGQEFQVNTEASYFHNSPQVAAAARGHFVVVWHVLSPSGRWASAQRFDAAGVPRGQNFVVQDGADWPAVASDAAGNFTVVAKANGIVGRRFTAGGDPMGAPFQVNTSTTYELSRPAIAMTPGGAFVVVWQGVQFAGPRFVVLGRRFDAAGAPLGGEFRVNTYTTALQGRAQVAVAASGDFVVTWDTVNDGSYSGILARRFVADGTAGAEFVVPAYTSGSQVYPCVASDEAGNFVVAWSSFGQDGSIYGAFARRFRADGTARGPDFRANTTTYLTQFAESVASDRAGNFAVTWAASSPDGGEVMAQRYGGFQPTELAVDTSGNAVLEPGESVDVHPTWRNDSGFGQRFSGVAAGLSGPLPATYELTDGSAGYGWVPNGEARRCVECYRIGVDAPTRPLLHWDAVLEEKILRDAQGQDKLWRLHVGGSFGDVPASSPFYPFVETLLHHGVTAGCGPATYCPASATTREQMAPFVLVAREGAGHAPPPCATPVFGDVPASSPFCRWIEELARRGVAGGCGGGNYCPGDPVTREQMAVFALRTLEPALSPPACGAPMFGDVPVSSPFCRWIEELARRGVVTGCGGGNFCPSAPVTREQMGVFIGATFGLSLYGP